MKDYKFVLYQILDMSAAELDDLFDRFIPMDIVTAVRSLIENRKDLCYLEINNEIFINAVWDIFDTYPSVPRELSMSFATSDEDNLVITTANEFYGANKANVDKLVEYMGLPLVMRDQL